MKYAPLSALGVLGLVTVTQFVACGGSHEEPGGNPDAAHDDAPTDQAVPDEGAGETMVEDATDADAAGCRWSMVDEGLTGGAVGSVAFAPAKDGPAFASVGNTVYRAPATLATWEKFGEAPSSIREFAFSPTATDEMYGASANGLLHSKDGGKTWSIAGLSGVSVMSTLVHPAERLRVFAGTSGAGIFRSTDGGATWIGSTLPSVQIQTTSFAAPSTNRDVVVAGYIALNDAGGWSLNGGLLRSTNGGAAWTKVFDGGSVHRVVSCAASPTTMWAATGKGLAKSTDGGANWSTISTSSNFLDVATASTSCDTIYATVYPTGVIRSDDGGANWTTPLTTGFALQEGARAPARIAVSADAPDRVAAATHGGLYTTTNRGALWTNTSGIKNLQVWRIASDSSAAYLATYGTGLWRKPADGPWARVAAVERDFVTSVFTTPDAGTLFAAAGPLYRSTDGAKTFSSVLSQYVFAMAFDPTASIVYATTQTAGVQKSTDGGATWTASNGGLTAWPTAAGTFIDVRGVALDPTTPTTVLIATNGRGFFRSTDGANWTATAPSMAMASVTSLLREKNGDLFAQIAGEGVARSTDFGSTWTYINTGLPTLEVSLFADPNSGDVYATSGKGLAVLKSGAMAWTLIDNECAPYRSYGQGAVVTSPGGSNALLAAGGSVIRVSL